MRDVRIARKPIMRVDVMTYVEVCGAPLDTTLAISFVFGYPIGQASEEENESLKLRHDHEIRRGTSCGPSQRSSARSAYPIQYKIVRIAGPTQIASTSQLVK